MLALSKIPTPPFPYAGASALYDGNEVTIHQRIGNDCALIHGTGITARVPLADLAPAATAGAFDLWHDAHVARSVAVLAPTPEADLYADFVVWLEATDYEANRYASRGAFADALADAGYVPTPIAATGFVRGRNPVEMAWNVVLSGEAA